MTKLTIVPSTSPLRLAAVLLATATVAGALFGAPPAWAAKQQSSKSTTSTASVASAPSYVALPATKIAVDLQTVISASATPTYSNWVRDINGVRFVKAIVVANPSADPDLASLRSKVLALGGSVYFRYTSVTALSVLLPAHRVIDIAGLAEVQGISPNRMTARTAMAMTPSAIETATGASTVRSRTGTGFSGLDGSGVGIAILDSGVMFRHQLFNDALGLSRVRRSVSFLRVGDATASGAKDWTPLIDASAGLYPGSVTMAAYEAKIDNSVTGMSDAYGHGSHVAAVAAGTT